MELTGNTILMTGGATGIGRALAEQFHQRGNQVIIASRRQSALDAVTTANPGIKSVVLDVEDPASIVAVAAQLTRDFPKLNVLFNNAGIMRTEDILKGATATAETTVTTNLLGPIRMTAALLPHLLQQPSATIFNVTSGLAYIPMAFTPTYCATKAAIHSYTLSLRYQLKDTAIRVSELIPPWIATELMGAKPDDPRAMPLEAFIAEVMQILTANPNTEEICVERVLPLRTATAKGNEHTFFKTFNDIMADRPH
jgi:uncharacterized oxidoreductase